MNPTESGLSLLAEQNVYAQLMIHHRAASVSTMQIENDRYFVTHPIAHKLTNVNTENYCISNLSPLFNTLPVNSIFDYISYVRPDLPDFRFVSIDNSSERNDGMSRKTISEDLESLNLHNPPALSRNIQTIFEPAPTTKSNSYNSKYHIQSMRQFDTMRAFPNLYTELVSLIEPLSPSTSPADKVTNVTDILQNMNINDIGFINSVVDNTVPNITDNAIKVRTTFDLVNSLDDESVSKLTGSVNKKIAKLVNDAVKNYRG